MKISIAPMLDLTDRHARFFLRQFSPNLLLYSEMISCGAILHNDPARFLDYSAAESPLVLQLGGSNPQDLARCAQLAEQWGYAEVNLNCGCPAERPQKGGFGACLMYQPQRVAECIAEMRAVCSLPITVKTRIGVDEEESYDFLLRFIEYQQQAGCEHFILHARKAWLSGLSPKENREIPPLNYDRVYQVKRDFPALTITLNGGVTDLTQAQTHLQHVDGVMIGRAAYYTPWILHQADALIWGGAVDSRNRVEILRSLYPYMEQQLSLGQPLSHIARHLLGLFHGEPGARAFRRYLSENMRQASAGLQVLEQALQLVR